MKNDLSCEVVQDLLPSYVDGLTCAVTTEAVEGHLSGCEACSEQVCRLREKLMPKEESEPGSWDKTVDAMTMNRQIRYWLYGILITLVLIMLLWIGGSLWNDWTMTNHHAGFKVTPTSWNIEVDDISGVVWLEVALPDGRASKNEDQSNYTYSYNHLDRSLTFDIKCSYVWGASGETVQTSYSFFDWFDWISEYHEDMDAPAEDSKFSDYVSAIYISTIDEPIWTAGEAG